jgi:hypothetical protein
MKEFKWRGQDNLGLWMGTTKPGDFPTVRRQQVGYVYKTRGGTYWGVVLFTGNIRTAVPTEQEARDMLMLLAKANC